MQNENLVEIGIRGAKSKTFRQTIVIHKKDKAMSKNTLNPLDPSVTIWSRLTASVYMTALFTALCCF